MGEPLVITADMLDPDDEVTETLRPAPMPATEPAPPPEPTTERRYEWVPVRDRHQRTHCYFDRKPLVNGKCGWCDNVQPPPAEEREP
jgi:hypothetical protein